jgi:hypothetical protein
LGDKCRYLWTRKLLLLKCGFHDYQAKGDENCPLKTGSAFICVVEPIKLSQFTQPNGWRARSTFLYHIRLKFFSWENKN